MDLNLIKDFFTLNSTCQQRRLKEIQTFLEQHPRINIFSLFKQISNGSGHELNQSNLKKYLSQFTSNLHIIQASQIIENGSKQFSRTKQPTETQKVQKGIKLFFQTYGNPRNMFSFREFSIFIKGQEILPDKVVDVTYQVRKKLFLIIQHQIQALINIQTIRQLCLNYYKNITDLFQSLANRQNSQIDKSSLRNLYLMHSQRKDQQFFINLQKRLHLPLMFEGFLAIFKSTQVKQLSSKTAQRKVYYSSLKRKKDHNMNINEEQSIISSKRSGIESGYDTPKTQKVIQRHGTSTKLTKGQKISQLKQNSINVSKFSLHDKCSQIELPTAIQILGQILILQQSFIQLKRNLILQKDFDLQLVYQNYGKQFQDILNNLYGCCNYSSFVRFIVPQDFQHKYLAFVRYQKTNLLTNQTIQRLQTLVQQFFRKENQIETLWSKVDKQMLFRMYCLPSDSNINAQQFNKFFTVRQCNVLLDRMDPLRSGSISYQNFK